MRRLTLFALLTLAAAPAAALPPDTEALLRARELSAVDALAAARRGEAAPHAEAIARLLAERLARDPAARACLLARLAAAPERGKFHRGPLAKVERLSPTLRLAEGRARAASLGVERVVDSSGPVTRWFESIQPEFALETTANGGFRARLFGEAARCEAFWNEGRYEKAAPRFDAAAAACLRVLDGCPPYDSAGESPYTKDLRLAVTSSAYRYFAWASLFSARARLNAGDPAGAETALETLLAALARPRKSGYRLLDRELAEVEAGFSALARYTLGRAAAARGDLALARRRLEAVAAKPCPPAMTLYRLTLGALREDDECLAQAFSVEDAAARRLATLKP